MQNVEVPDVIKTQRLELRLLDLSMVPEMSAAIHASAKEFQPWFDWVHPTLPSLEDTMEFSCQNIKGQKAKEEFHYCIYEKTENVLVGRISFDKAKPTVPSYNIGYWMHSNYTGHGYMLEAAKGLINMAWNAWPVRRLEIYHDTYNHASAKIIQNLCNEFGFIKESESANCLRSLYDDTLRTHIGYTLTRGDDELS